MAMSVANVISSYSIKEVDIEKFPTLHRYVWKGKFQKVLIFLSEEEQYCKVNKTDFCQRTPLHLAASKGDVKTLQFLLSIDVKSINRLDSDGCTAFSKASQILSLDCMKLLASYDADATCVNFKQHSILEMLIIESGDGAIPCLQYLLTNQKPDKRSHDGLKLFHIAVRYGRARVVDLLIQSGIDIDLPIDDTGKTPLMKAAESGFFTIVQTLLKHNANIYSKDINGLDVKSYAENHLKILELIEEYNYAHDKLDTPSTNKVFVTFHKSSPPSTNDDNIRKKLLLLEEEGVKKELLFKIATAVKEIKRYELNIKNAQERSKELEEELSNVNANNSKIIIDKDSSLENAPTKENLKPKVKLKRFFKSAYQTKEEWVQEFDEFVDKYNELQGDYEKLLLVESERECEVEECLDVLRQREKNNLKNDAEAYRMKKELDELKQKMDDVVTQKKLTKCEIEEVKEMIPADQSKFKHFIEQANTIKSKLMKNIETIKIKKRQKSEELQDYSEEESNFLKEIERCEQLLDAQKKMRVKLAHNIKSIKTKCKNIESENKAT